jgi:hypothetical protein
MSVCAKTRDFGVGSVKDFITIGNLISARAGRAIENESSVVAIFKTE